MIWRIYYFLFLCWTIVFQIFLQILLDLQNDAYTICKLMYSRRIKFLVFG